MDDTYSHYSRRSYGRLRGEPDPQSWGGLPPELGARYPAYPYGFMPLASWLERDRWFTGRPSPNDPLERQNQWPSMLYMSRMINLPPSLLWLMTPTMVAGIVAQMLNGTPAQRKKLAQQYGIVDNDPKPKKSDREIQEDRDLMLAVTAPLMVVAPLVLMRAGWQFLAVISRDLVANVAAVGRRGLRATLRATQAIEQNVISLAMPHPRPTPIVPTPDIPA